MLGRLRVVGVVVVSLSVVGLVPVTLAQTVPVHGNGPYTPPPCVAGVPFADITCTTFYDAWIEQFARDGITAGCGGGNYCPNENVTRAQMAVFVEAAMRGTGSWPAHTQLVWAVKAADGSPDPIASGTALLNAVAAIPTSGNDAPSASNPWLLKIGPGVFDLSTGQLDLPSYVNLEGSGQDVTTVQSVNSDSTLVVIGTNRVSSLTVANTAVTVVTTAVNASSGAVLTLNHVTIQALHGTGATYGIFSYNSYLNVYDGSIVAFGGTAYGLVASGGTPHTTQVWRTLFSSGSADIYADSGQQVDLAYARVPDGLTNNGGTYKCIGNYDFNLAPVTCP
jgi:hypothetical protein